MRSWSSRSCAHLLLLSPQVSPAEESAALKTTHDRLLLASSPVEHRSHCDGDRVGLAGKLLQATLDHHCGEAEEQVQRRESVFDDMILYLPVKSMRRLYYAGFLRIPLQITLAHNVARRLDLRGIPRLYNCQLRCSMCSSSWIRDSCSLTENSLFKYLL